jgi:PKD repeat protein
MRIELESISNSTDEILPYIFPSTADSYWVKVTLHNDTSGCAYVDSIQINITSPLADFTYGNFDVCANVEIEFNGSGSQNATEYYWDFGDGTTSGWVNNSIVNHAFNNAGTFEVLLIVRNSNGCLDSVIHQIHIIGPEIHVDFSDTFVYVDETITFVDNSVADEPIISVHWVFGDGDNLSGSSVSHEYSQPGTYSVTIYVMTASGCVGEKTYPDAITVVAEPSINFTIFPASGPTNADGYVEVNIVGGVPPFDVNCSSAKSEYDISNLAPGNYVLSVEDANGHTASVQFEMTWTTGINTIEFTDSFYPNPASEFIIIQSTNNSLASLEIIDLNGKILLRKDFLSDNEVVDVTSLENGIYLVRTYHQGYSRITKLLICR